MSRERWFYAKDLRRMGPLPRRQLVESLLALPDPRSCLIWHHGLPAWTPAREVPEIDRQLAPFVRAAPSPAPEPAPSPAPSPGAARAAPATEQTLRVPSRPGRELRRPAEPNVGLYLGGLAALLGVVVVGWLLWPPSNDDQGPEPAPAAQAKSGGAPLASPGPGAGGLPFGGASPGPGAGGVPSAGTATNTPGFAGWSDEEADLPLADLRRLRGVGGWSGERLRITLYNGSAWRITEILVRTSRLRGDEFVDAETPHRLLPVGGAPVDAGVADLLEKVAPDRKKPGVNPLDTGPFEAAVGPKPEAYRWKIEGARGYPPRL